MKCKGCSRIIQIGVLTDGKTYCEDCFKVVIPATLTIIKQWHSHRMYSPNNNAFLNYGLEFYKGCGFKIYKQVEYFNRDRSPDVQKHWVLRFFGNIRCNLVRDNYPWAAGTKVCRTTHCKGYNVENSVLTHHT